MRKTILLFPSFGLAQILSLPSLLYVDADQNTDDIAMYLWYDAFCIEKRRDGT
jgi:hypothetical protein